MNKTEEQSPLPSLYQLLRLHLGFTSVPLRCTKPFFVHISHAFENVLFQNNLSGYFFAGFQHWPYFKPEHERYQQLSQQLERLVVFANGDPPTDNRPKRTYITLSPDDPLVQEWFLLLIDPRFSVLISGIQTSDQHEIEENRLFEILWSFEPQIIQSAYAILQQRFPAEISFPQCDLSQLNVDLPLMHQVIEIIRAAELSYHERVIHTISYFERQRALRDQMVEALVHDMRTPLQSMLQTIGFLRQATQVEPLLYQELMDMAQTSTEGLLHMVNMLLDTNQLEADRLKPDWHATTPQQLLHQALAPLRPLFTLGSITLRIEIAPNVTHLWCDYHLIARSIQNLVGNALKFTPAGGTIQIGFDTIPLQAHTITVSDTGIGIPPEDLNHIFERFFQRTPHQRKGSGIGLYFCKLVAEAHGGSVTARSILDQGTTFTINLPFHPPHWNKTP